MTRLLGACTAAAAAQHKPGLADGFSCQVRILPTRPRESARLNRGWPIRVALIETLQLLALWLALYHPDQHSIAEQLFEQPLVTRIMDGGRPANVHVHNWSTASSRDIRFRDGPVN